MYSGEISEPFDWEETTPQGKAELAAKILTQPPAEQCSPAPSTRGVSGDLYTVKPMNDWIKESINTKVPSKLCGELWYESEIAILFASSFVGKTIFSYQAGDAISKGTACLIGLGLEDFFPTTPKKILYMDLELSAKQIEKRYSNDYTNHYQWSPNFYRLEMNPDSEIPTKGNYDEYIMQQIEATLIKVGANILIVDNITYFRDDQEQAKDALRMMKQLKKLRTKLSLSILILAHTPKRDNTRPISRNDLAGSSMILNYVDSSFTIGESKTGTSTRYIKQIKPSRFSKTTYDANNVITCEIKNPDNFTRFEYSFHGGSEGYHLEAKDKEYRNGKIKDMTKQGASLRDIAESVNLSHTMVAKIQKRYGSNE
jgi:RecA-family ATPase